MGKHTSLPLQPFIRGFVMGALGNEVTEGVPLGGGGGITFMNKKWPNQNIPSVNLISPNYYTFDFFFTGGGGVVRCTASVAPPLPKCVHVVRDKAQRGTLMAPLTPPPLASPTVCGHLPRSAVPCRL